MPAADVKQTAAPALTEACKPESLSQKVLKGTRNIRLDLLGKLSALACMEPQHASKHLPSTRTIDRIKA